MEKTCFDDIKVGTKVSIDRKVTENDINKFLSISKDSNPLHSDEEYAKKTGFRSRVVPGYLLITWLSELFPSIGIYIVLLETKTKYLKPVRIGDTITLQLEIIDKNPDNKQIKAIKRVIKDNEVLVEMEEISIPIKYID